VLRCMPQHPARGTMAMHDEMKINVCDSGARK
jgi:hypothetical protein